MKKKLLTALSVLSIAVFATTTLNIGTASAAVTLHTWQQYSSGGPVNGGYLRANSSRQVYTYASNDAATKWVHIAIGTSTSVRLMKNNYTGQCLDSNASGYVYTNPCSTSNRYQQWYPVKISTTGYYQVKNVATNRCLSTKSPNVYSTAITVVCGTGNANFGQYWY